MYIYVELRNNFFVSTNPNSISLKFYFSNNCENRKLFLDKLALCQVTESISQKSIY